MEKTKTMQIWKERIMGKNGRKETKQSFDKFQRYLTELPKPRKLYDLATLLLYNEKNSKKLEKTRKIQRQYKSLYFLYRNYNWEERSNAYDDYWNNKREQAKQDEILKIELKNIPLIAQRLDGHNIDYQELMQNTTEKVVVDKQLVEREIRPIDKTNAKLNNANALKTDIESLYLLVNGGKLKTESKSESDVNVKTDLEGIDYFKDKSDYQKPFVDDDLLD